MKKTTFILSLLAVLFFACQTKTQTAQSAAVEQQAPYLDIGVEEFKQKIGGENVVLIDVRTPDEIADGKIEGAMEIDFYGDGFDEKINALSKDKTYLIYCRSGNRSGQTCQLMASKGYKNLFNLDGGFMAWSDSE